MKRFIPREKLGKRARKQLDSGQRITWSLPPVTKKVESKKLYNRKRKAHDRYDDYGVGFFIIPSMRCPNGIRPWKSGFSCGRDRTAPGSWEAGRPAASR